MKGLLFFDIDGTLDDSQNQKGIPASAKEALQKARANGYGLMIASGRSLAGLKGYEDLGFDGYVFSDGAGIFLKGRPLIKHPIEPEAVRFAMKHNVMLSGTEKMYAADAMLAKLAALFGIPKEMMAVAGVFPLDAYDGEDILEIDIDFENEEAEAAFLAEKPDVMDYVCTSASYGRGGACGELTAHGIDKGHGILEAASLLGVAHEDTYAFGDSENDASMIKAAGHGIAMGNSVEILKEQADYVVADIGDDGLFKALLHFGIIF